MDPSLRLAPVGYCEKAIVRSGPDGHSDTRRRGEQRIKAAGLRHARATIAADVDDAAALAIAGLVIGHLGKDHESAIRSIERALSINASSATAHYSAAHVYSFSGDHEAATAHADRALRLSPFDPLAFEAHCAHGVSALHQARYADAATCFAKASQTNAGSGIANFAHAAALALAGRVDEGRGLAGQDLERAPGAWARLFSETGMTRDITDKFDEGARLLERLE